MIPLEFRAFRQRLGLTQPQLGTLLGLTVGTISRYETGSQPIPRAVELAMRGLEAADPNVVS